MTWLPGWAFRKRIIIPSVHVDSDLVDFPFYVKIDDADFHEARADGFDIRFTLSDGTTLLKYEREYWTGGNGSPAIAHLWVKVPSILASGGATIYVYYGKRDAPDGEDAPNVWDANFKGVWHMKDKTPSTIADSIGVNDGTKKAANEPIEVDGKVYKGQDFDGVDDYVDCGNDENLQIAGSFTIGALINTNAISEIKMIARKGAFATPGAYFLWLNTNYTISVYFYDDGGVAKSLTSTQTVNIGEWAYVAGMYDAGSQLRVYVNNVERVGSQTATHPAETAENLFIGARAGTANFFDGLIDEVRISNAPRTLAWHKFEHYNINEADNEITWGAEEAVDRGVQASREEKELLLIDGKEPVFIGRKKPVFISRK